MFLQWKHNLALLREDLGYCGFNFLVSVCESKSIPGKFICVALDTSYTTTKQCFWSFKFFFNKDCPLPGNFIQLYELSSLRHRVREPLASFSLFCPWLILWPSKLRQRYPRKGGCIDCSRELRFLRFSGCLIDDVWCRKAAFRETLRCGGGGSKFKSTTGFCRLNRELAGGFG